MINFLKCKVCKTIDTWKWYNCECCSDCYKKGLYADDLESKYSKEDEDEM